MEQLLAIGIATDTIYRYDLEATKEVFVTDCYEHIYIYVQMLSDLGIEISCLAQLDKYESTVSMLQSYKCMHLTNS